MARRPQDTETGCTYSLKRISRFIEPSLLLFLSKGSSHGYELLERVRSLGFEADQVDVGGVYRCLRRMEKEGLVRSRWDRASGRKRRIYSITDKGLDVLEEWVRRIEQRRQALDRFLRIYKGRRR